MKKFTYLFLVFHFGLMITGMCNIGFKRFGQIGEILDIYGRATGSRGSFGFFSPNVGNQFVVTFEVMDSDGKVNVVRLEDLVTPESSIRVGNMHRLFATFFGHPTARRSIASSLTTYIFERFPAAKEIVFKADFFEFPSLAAFEKGAKAITSPIYRATFQRKQKS